MSWLSILNVSNLKRGAKMLPHYLIEGNDVQARFLDEAVRGTKVVTNRRYVADAAGKINVAEETARVGGKGLKNFGQTLKDSFKASERASTAAYAANGGSAWQYLKNAFKSIPGELATGWKTGGAAVAKDAGRLAKLGGSFKGLGSAIGKRMPFIGTAIYALTTLPNIFRATKEAGVVAGAGEVVKTVGSLTGFTVGCAIGQALIPIPFVGGLVGGLVGGFIADKIVGKSYTEKKAELQQQALVQAQQAVPQGHMDTGSTNPFAAGLTPEQQYQLAMLQQQYGPTVRV